MSAGWRRSGARPAPSNGNRDGTWTIAPDHLDRVRDYEQRLAQAQPVTIETLSTVPIERQIGAEGATWLDRQLTREVDQERAGHGFGRDVRQALVRRQQWLIEQGLDAARRQ